MSGSDRTLTAQRSSPRVTRVNAGAGSKAQDAQAAREIKITRALAVAALGPERVLRAERLRAKGWSVRGIADQVGCTEAEASALFGLAAPGTSAPSGRLAERESEGANEGGPL